MPHGFSCSPVLNLKALVDETNATIQIKNLPEIDGYKHQLIQLFQNLIGNALKFCKKGVRPFIQIYARKAESHFIIYVQDNGIGIPQEAKSRVFEIFQRLHSKTDYGGTGIGLSICKKVVQMHNGEIGFESKENEGTVFYFSLQFNEQDL